MAVGARAVLREDGDLLTCGTCWQWYRGGGEEDFWRGALGLLSAPRFCVLLGREWEEFVCAKGEDFMEPCAHESSSTGEGFMEAIFSVHDSSPSIGTLIGTNDEDTMTCAVMEARLMLVCIPSQAFWLGEDLQWQVRDLGQVVF
jgi:hypothetical protein